MTLKGKARSFYVFKKGSHIIPRSSPLGEQSGYEFIGFLPLERFLVDENRDVQGIYQRFRLDFVPSNQELPAAAEIVKKLDDGIIYRYLHKSLTYEDSGLNGPVTEYDADGKIRRITNYKDDEKEGLETNYDQEGNATYTLYRNGKKVADDAELRLQWSEIVEGLRFEKEMDKGRSATLEKVLEAGSKEDKMRALQEFHSKESPVGVKRRTALKLAR